MVEKFKVDRWVFLKTGFVTALIFIAGLLLGYSLDTTRNGFLEQEALSLSVETESFVISQLYMEKNSNYCNIIEPRISQVASSVDTLGNDLASLEGKSSFINTTLIDRRYFIYEVRFWMLAEDYKTKCGKNLTTILFFYRNDQEKSREQGVVMTAIKDEFGSSVLIFSFEKNFPEPTIDLIKQDFNITTIPTLVINKKKYEGFIDKDTLRKIILNSA